MADTPEMLTADVARELMDALGLDPDKAVRRIVIEFDGLSFPTATVTHYVDNKDASKLAMLMRKYVPIADADSKEPE